jgi:hypothetical protein
MWLTTLLRELGVSYQQPATLWCDNVSAIYLASNPVFHACTKHVEIDYHFLRDQLRLGLIQLHFLKSSEQLADILTKPLGRQLFSEHVSKLCLSSVSTQLEEAC